MRGIAWLHGILMVGLLAGCGDTLTSQSSSATGATPASITIISDAPQIGTASTEVANLTVYVKDNSNNALSGETVTFSSSSGLLVVTQAQTDSSGAAKATLSPGTDASNRTITVTATAGSVSTTYAVLVSGTVLSIAGASSVVFRDATALTVTAKDSNGAGIPGTTIALSSSKGNIFSASTLTTDENGQISASYQATVASGSDTVTASALGATATHSIGVSADQFSVSMASEVKINTCAPITVTWLSGTTPVGASVDFNTTRGTLYTDSSCATAGTQITTSAITGEGTIYIKSPNTGPTTVTASGTGAATSANTGAEFVATTPATLVLQADTTTLGLNDSAALTATVRDANYNLVKNAAIVFKIEQDTTGGYINVGMATTDSLGRASTTYYSTSQSSETDGVVISATVNGKTITDTVQLTVGGSGVSVHVGMATKITNYNTSTYQYSGSVSVADAAGNPVKNQTVTLRLVPESYDKGYRVGTDAYSNVGGDFTYTLYANNNTLSCANEDINLNGILDSGEDINGNDTLEPGWASNINGSVVTDSYGIAEFAVTYPKDYADWLQVKIVATAQVNGTESSTYLRFILPMSQSDASSPPGIFSPFGTANTCTNPG